MAHQVYDAGHKEGSSVNERNYLHFNSLDCPESTCHDFIMAPKEDDTGLLIAVVITLSSCNVPYFIVVHTDVRKLTESR